MSENTRLVQDAPDLLISEISRLQDLQTAIRSTESGKQREQVLDNNALVRDFFESRPLWEKTVAKLDPVEAYAIKSLIAAGQGPHILEPWNEENNLSAELHRLAQQLLPIEKFYHMLGGVIGYQLTVLQLLQERTSSSSTDAAHQTIQYSRPPCEDIRSTTPRVRHAILQAVKRLAEIGELFAVGGAGDRLDLSDPESREALPAAKLIFGGHTLLESLIYDVQAREYLHYKVFGGQITTPIAMMTSDEKNNHAHIRDICEEANWFGRPRASFLLFNQPLTPLVSEQGEWCVSAPFTLACKPGGHGVIWKLMENRGVFDWFASHGRSYTLIHQINNPIASLDYGMLAFTGFGLENEHVFGFCTCDRKVHSAEGMVVLEKRQDDKGYSYGITNIEYTEFAKKGISDQPAQEGGHYSIFPANSNILFGHLPSIQQVLPACPLPGLLLNMKSQGTVYNASGERQEIRAGRLESTMQNIADQLTNTTRHVFSDEEELYNLSTYATYNHRNKTLSTTKNSFTEGSSLEGTPWGAYYHIQTVLREALIKQAGCTLPLQLPKEQVVTHPAPYLLWLHPALGPLFSIIAQKLRNSTLHEGSELVIHAAEVDIDRVSINGSLRIHAEEPLGHRDGDGHIQYSKYGGKCTLHKVSINNFGIDHSLSHNYWQGPALAKEAVTILLRGSGEFIAHDVRFQGAQTITVEDRERVTAVQDKNGNIKFIREIIQEPSWHWNYQIKESTIHLLK